MSSPQLQTALTALRNPKIPPVLACNYLTLPADLILLPRQQEWVQKFAAFQENPSYATLLEQSELLQNLCNNFLKYEAFFDFWLKQGVQNLLKKTYAGGSGPMQNHFICQVCNALVDREVLPVDPSASAQNHARRVSAHYFEAHKISKEFFRVAAPELPK